MCGNAFGEGAANDERVALGVDDTRRNEAAVEVQCRCGGSVLKARATAGHARTQIVGAPLHDGVTRLGRSIGGRERLGGRGQPVGRTLSDALGVAPLPPRAPLGLCRKPCSLALDDHVLQRTHRQ